MPGEMSKVFVCCVGKHGQPLSKFTPKRHTCDFDGFQQDMLANRGTILVHNPTELGPPKITYSN